MIQDRHCCCCCCCCCIEWCCCQWHWPWVTWTTIQLFETFLILTHRKCIHHRRMESPLLLLRTPTA